MCYQVHSFVIAARIIWRNCKARIVWIKVKQQSFRQMAGWSVLHLIASGGQ
jgi:hypothetical protein